MAPDKHDLLPIGEIAHRSGFAPSAIRFYEAEGLISSVRNSGNQRRFERSTLRRLAFVRAAVNVGLSLDEIRIELDSLPAGRNPTKADWSRISHHWRGRLQAQIEALERLRDGLDSCIGCGCLSLTACTFSNPGDVSGRQGAVGAAFLPAPLRSPRPQ